MKFIEKNGKGLALCLVIAIPSWLLGRIFPVIGGAVIAILAGMGVGLYGSRADAIGRLPPPEAFSPDPAAAAFYCDLYAVFQDAYAGLSDVLSRLAVLRYPSEVTA